MRPIRLKMTAFGPYAGTVDLNFDEGLAGENLFLIHGATGAGKTSILDAICYALYDKTSGGERSDQMMRSEMAAVNDKTEVEFEFAIGATLYKIRRNPECGSFKKAAALYRSGNLIAVTSREVSSNVKNIIGFDVDQFCKVVLLPQGKFKDFLMSNAGERGKVLNTIFDANFYGLIEDKFKAAADAAKKIYDKLLTQRENLLENSREIGVSDEKIIPALMNTAAENLSRSQNKLGALKGKLDEALENLTAGEVKILELDKINSAVVELNNKRRKLDAAIENETVAQKSLIELEKKRKSYEDRLAELKARETELQGADVDAVRAEQQLKDAASRDAALKEIARLQKESAAIQKRLAAAMKNYDDAQKYLKQLQLIQKMCTAAKLAESLVDGEPCPVCGALHHPSPAATDEIIPDDEQIERAEKVIEKRQMELDLAKRAVTQNSEKIGAQNDLLEKFTSAPNAADAQKIFDAAKIHADKLKDCRERLRKGGDLVEKIAGEIESARRTAEMKKNLAATLRGQIDEKLQQIPADYLNAPEKLAADMSAAQQSKKILDDAKTFAQNAHTAAVAEISKLEERLSRLQEISDKLKRLDGEIKTAEGNYQIWKRLSDVANGAVSRVTFQRYYLNAIFKDVVLEANERFDRMSGGRYRFRGEKNALTKKRLAGLDLEILDAYTGTARPVETLSGGESFLASLSLALGLAAVVKNLAGGIKLDTIFIDEGFGSLDNETLDVAMNALTDLQSGGRLVGIISHVDELKRRIPVRLEVTKTKAGSTAKFIG